MKSEKISEYFYRHEMACKCGCGLDSMDGATLRIADEVRERNGGPITPRSAHRCFRHNFNEGGSALSQHLYARALDLPVENPREIYDYLCEKYPDRYGFGLYEDFVHVDTRSGPKARWIEI